MPGAAGERDTGRRPGLPGMARMVVPGADIWLSG
jgi:hypothetical protein